MTSPVLSLSWEHPHDRNETYRKRSQAPYPCQHRNTYQKENACPPVFLFYLGNTFPMNLLSRGKAHCILTVYGLSISFWCCQVCMLWNWCEYILLSVFSLVLFHIQIVYVNRTLMLFIFIVILCPLSGNIIICFLICLSLNTYIICSSLVSIKSI